MSTKEKILVAEDEPGMLRLIESNLERAGFVVGQVTNGNEVAARVLAWKPALLLLDVMLPGKSGFEVCRGLKNDPRTRQMPIVLLTAKALEQDRVQGLEQGADDYVTKPFSPRELVLRVQARLRKFPPNEHAGDLVQVGEIVLDRSEPAAEVAGRRLALTATEYKLLLVLMERVGRVQTRERLLSDVWGYEAAIESRTVDIYVTRLRAKLGRSGAHLETVRGFGYRLVETPAR